MTKNIHFSLGLYKKNANNYENFEAEIKISIGSRGKLQVRLIQAIIRRITEYKLNVILLKGDRIRNLCQKSWGNNEEEDGLEIV